MKAQDNPTIAESVAVPGAPMGERMKEHDNPRPPVGTAAVPGAPMGEENGGNNERV